MAFQSVLLKILATCTLIVVIATIIMADHMEENLQEVADELRLQKRNAADDWLDFLDKRGRTRGTGGRRRKQFVCLEQGKACTVVGPIKNITPCCAPMGCYDTRGDRCKPRDNCICRRENWTVDF